MSLNVETPSTQHDYMMSQWQLPMDLMGGLKAMIANAAEYLPMEPAESEKAYKVRLKRTNLYNVFRKVIMSSAGQALAQGVAVHNMPEALKFLEHNATGDGRSITELANDIIQHHLLYGKSHMVVDFPNITTQQMSYSEFKGSGFNPYFNLVSPISVIGWQYHTNYGYPKLTNVRIVENEVMDSTEPSFVMDERKIVRVYYDGFVEKWVYNEDDDQYITESTYKNSLGFIPLVTGYANKKGFMISEPPLEDLARTNLTHFQSSSDQRNILHIARVPFILATGFKDQELNNMEIGANRVVTTTNHEADMKYVEHTGKSIESGEKDLKTLEEQMKILGASIVMNQSADRQTATARQIDQLESMSLMQLSIRSTCRMLEDAITIAGLWLGVDASDVTVSIGDDNSLPNEPNAHAGLKILQDTGLLDDEGLFAEAQRRGIISPTAIYIPLEKRKPAEQELQKQQDGDEISNPPEEEQEEDAEESSKE